MVNREDGLRRSSRLISNTTSRNRARLPSKTPKQAAFKPKRVRKVTATRATPSLEDPAAVPLLDRPFVIYGLNNRPYMVNARPLGELIASHICFTIDPDRPASTNDECEVSPHIEEVLPSSSQSNERDPCEQVSSFSPDCPGPSLELEPSVSHIRINQCRRLRISCRQVMQNWTLPAISMGSKSERQWPFRV